jgi:hypothetical protein
MGLSMLWVRVGEVLQAPPWPVIYADMYVRDGQALMRKKVERIVEHGERFQMRASKTFFELLDNWRRQQPDIPGRSEAIRRLVEKGVAAEAAETAKPKRGK